MVLLKSLSLPMGTPAPDFVLPATDEKEYGLSDFSDKKLLVIIFMCNHCPYVHEVLEKLTELQAHYADKEVQVIGINPNDSDGYPEDSFEAMKEMEMNFIYLRDKSQEVARAYQAQCTPDMYVFDQERKLAYHGHVDGIPKALDNLLAGDPVEEEQMHSMGCSIKWK